MTNNEEYCVEFLADAVKRYGLTREQVNEIARLACITSGLTPMSSACGLGPIGTELYFWPHDIYGGSTGAVGATGHRVAYGTGPRGMTGITGPCGGPTSSPVPFTPRPPKPDPVTESPESEPFAKWIR